MPVCFGRNICNAVTGTHLANLPRDFILFGVSAALSLWAVMFKSVLQSQWSAGALCGLPPRVIHRNCVRNWLKRGGDRAHCD